MAVWRWLRALPDASEIDVLEVIPLAGGAFSAQLVPQIAALLEKHGHTKRDLGAFVVANGPGSFTGLRVGLAAMKALAEALQKPLVAISLLEAVARGGKADGRVLAAMDAAAPTYTSATTNSDRKLARTPRAQRTPIKPGRVFNRCQQCCRDRSNGCHARFRRWQTQFAPQESRSSRLSFPTLE